MDPIMRRMSLSLTVLAACTGPDPAGPDGSSTVRPPVASVTFEPACAQLTVGGTVYATVVLRDANGRMLGDRDIIFTSSKPQVVTVNYRGLLQGISQGDATITAVSEGKRGLLIVSVFPPDEDACQGCWDYSPRP